MRDVLGDPAWPDDFWKASTPEAEGLDGSRLEAAVRAVEDRRWAVHSFLVIRHGRLVLERYGEDGGRPFGPGDLHELHSATKTFTSALVGIAVGEGKLAGVSARALDAFPGGEVERRSPEKERITIEDLLTMRSGLAYELFVDDDRMLADPRGAARYILSQPLAAEPGRRWSYSSGDSQVLAELVRRATGETPYAYAGPRLFAPLGIRDLRWPQDRTGTEVGGFGLWLRPRDLARFGLMLLDGGRFRGAQVVPAAWAQAMGRGRAETPWAAGTYAWHCWAPRIGGFAARGMAGQEAYLFPDRDLLVVFTAGLPADGADAMLDELVRDFVLPALR